MRADATARAIDKALRAVGATVEPIHGRRGVPDRLVGFAGRNLLLEYKSARAYRKDGTLGLSDQLTTEDQALWASKWRGDLPHVVASPEEALRAIGATGHPPIGALDMMDPAVVAARRSPRRTAGTAAK